MDLATFIATYNGTFVNFNGTTHQCMDLYRKYVQLVWQLPQTPGVVGAYQVFNTLGSDYIKIPYTAGAFPLPGDVVCWNQSFSAFGHIAIVNTANASTMQVFEQNDPIGAPSQLGTHGYSNVTGWFRPVGGVSPTPPDPIQPITSLRYIILDGHKYVIQTDTYNMKWTRSFSSQLAGNIIRLNFVDRGAGIRVFDFTLILETWAVNSLPYKDGVTESWDTQLQNLEASYALKARILPFQDPTGRSPGPSAQNGVFFTNLTEIIPKYATPLKPIVLAQIELTEATQLINGGQNQ